MGPARQEMNRLVAGDGSGQRSDVAAGHPARDWAGCLGRTDATCHARGGGEYVSHAWGFRDGSDVLQRSAASTGVCQPL